jgi:hypothetical protein
MQLDLEVGALGLEIERLLRSRSGRLVAVTIGAPRGVDVTELVTKLQDLLGAGGLTGVDVQVVPEGPRLRLINLEFTR